MSVSVISIINGLLVLFLTFGSPCSECTVIFTVHRFLFITVASVCRRNNGMEGTQLWGPGVISESTEYPYAIM
jgi:hypothetical protein